MINLTCNSKVDVRILESMLDYSNFTTSYKLFWINGIFKEIIRGNQDMSFKRIACRMICSAWYPLVKYDLNFGAQDQLFETVKAIKSKYNIKDDDNEDIILEYLYNLDDEDIDEFVQMLCRYVPYRLLTPFYKDILKGKKDGVKNKIIYESAIKDPNVFYKINDNMSITVNDNWFDYIYENQSIISGWINYKLIYFLQKKNPNVPAIPFKLSPVHKRELNKAKKFWKTVNDKTVVIDIYTEKELNEHNFEKHGGFSIDHFIPWSFVLHDELWNLVPTFKNINSAKSNSLPHMNHYFDKFCDMQYSAFNLIRSEEKMRNYLEDYLNINVPLVLDPISKKYKDIDKNTFITLLKDTISPLYQIAYNQGYNIWE
jgi:hypothetical protein